MIWLKSGIPAIDADHQRLVKLITLAKTTPNDTASNILNVDFLKNITTLIKAHFEREEDVMFSLRYKHMNDHIADHSIILSALTGITDRFENGDISLNEIFNRILLLDDHKKLHDIKLSEFMNNAKSSKSLSTNSRLSSRSRPHSGTKGSANIT